MVTHVYTEGSPFNILLIDYLLLYNGKANKNECFKYAQASFVTRYIVQGRWEDELNGEARTCVRGKGSFWSYIVSNGISKSKKLQSL